MNGCPYSERELATLRELYPDTPTKVIAERLGRTLASVYHFAGLQGLSKSEAYRASPAACRLRRGDQVGKDCRFPKGHVPANKGLRRPGYAPGRMAETQFKKGNSTNSMPVGAKRLVGGYVYRKISDIPNVPWTTNWRVEHHLVWEEAGKPPFDWHKHVLIFKDGNRLNTKLRNLKLITRKQNMRRNTIHARYPKELVAAIMMNGALKRQLKRRGERNGEEQTGGCTQPSL